MATASSTKLRPLGDRVVIKPTPREEMTKSGIVLPDTAKEKPQEGEILAVGPGKTLDDGSREAMDVAVGNKVLYAKYAGTEFKVDSDELLIVSQKDILAIVEDSTSRWLRASPRRSESERGSPLRSQLTAIPGGNPTWPSSSSSTRPLVAR